MAVHAVYVWPQMFLVNVYERIFLSTKYTMQFHDAVECDVIYLHPPLPPFRLQYTQSSSLLGRCLHLACSLLAPCLLLVCTKCCCRDSVVGRWQ